jgi:hypothetical protein
MRRETRFTGTLVLVGATLLTAASARANPPVVSPSAALPTPAASTPAAQYLHLAETSNRRLERDFDRLAGPDREHLGAALADLHDAVSTERAFDRDLLRLSLPAPVEATTHDLVRANESRIRLTSAMSDYHSLWQLRRGENVLEAADAAVEVPVRSIRQQLGLPPPPTS